MKYNYSVDSSSTLSTVTESSRSTLSTLSTVTAAGVLPPWVIVDECVVVDSRWSCCLKSDSHTELFLLSDDSSCISCVWLVPLHPWPSSPSFSSNAHMMFLFMFVSSDNILDQTGQTSHVCTVWLLFSLTDLHSATWNQAQFGTDYK